MELRLPRKGIAVVTAAVLLGTAVLTAKLNVIGVSAEVKKQTKPESSASEQISEKESGEYEVTSWWKADLSEYSENFSVVSYETVEIPKEEKNKKAAEGVVVNDTGVSYVEPELVYQENDTGINYIEQDSDYQAIQIIPETNVSEYENSYVPETPVSPVPERPSAGEVHAEPGSFVFTTYGYGHGVGMSQNGANHYASYSGWNYQQILSHYYPGTYIQNTGRTGDTITAGGVSGTVLDIVSMVTYNEVGSSMANEAIRAQAVAAYTYIMYKGGNAPDLCPKPSPPQNVVDAVKSVLGEALYYNGSVALSMFGASSGGSTASCVDIFYQDIPYLRSVYCDYDVQCDPHYGSVEVLSEDEVRADLESCLGITLSDNPENWISIREGDGGYAAYVTVDNQVTIKGNDFRVYLGLKSPKFTVSYN